MGEAQGVGAQPRLPSFCPSPWLFLWFCCHSRPLVPAEACPALLSPMPLPPGTSSPCSPGAGAENEGGPARGCEALSPAAHRQHLQNKATDSVTLLQLCSFSGPSSTRCQDCGGPGRVRARPAGPLSEPALGSAASYLTGLFSGILRGSGPTSCHI